MSDLRAATLQDLPHIVALDQEIFGAYGADESPEIIQARLEVFPAGCYVLVEPASVTISGYLTTEKWDDEREPALDEDPRQTHQPEGRVLNITTLAIAPNQQGRGLGQRLIEQAVTIARREQCTQIVLETAHAKAFYLNHGFTVIGDRHQRDILLYIMQLKLEGGDP